ncbi:MAG: hypothetical protein ACKV2U_17975 [Bryobacteraceae bacterium]
MVPPEIGVAGVSNAEYKTATHGWWAIGATTGSLIGAQLTGWMGRRRSWRLPELFPVSVRATGSGLACNSGGFATTADVPGARRLFSALGVDYPRVGTIGAGIYALGIAAIRLVEQPRV